MEITPTGLSGLNAARLAVEGRRRARDPAAVLLHREMVGHVWENRRNWLNATSRNAIVGLVFILFILISQKWKRRISRDLKFVI